MEGDGKFLIIKSNVYFVSFSICLKKFERVLLTLVGMVLLWFQSKWSNAALKKGFSSSSTILTLLSSSGFISTSVNWNVCCSLSLDVICCFLSGLTSGVTSASCCWNRIGRFFKLLQPSDSARPKNWKNSDTSEYLSFLPFQKKHFNVCSFIIIKWVSKWIATQNMNWGDKFAWLDKKSE